MRKLILFLFLVCAWPAHAGYYSRITATTVPELVGAVGTTTSCYLTPTMSIAALGAGFPHTVTTITGDTSGGSIGFYLASSTGSNVTVEYATCSAVPVVASFPTFLGGLTDPAITGNTIDGGTITSGTSTPLAVEVTVTEPPMAFLDPEQAIGNASEWFGLTMVFWAGVWGLRRVYDLFTQNHV